MRFTLSSSVLNGRLSTLSRVINNKNALPILDCFLFEVSGNTLTITASDSENVMKSTILLDECSGDGKFAVNNRTILDAVKELPEQPLVMDVDTTSFAIKVIYQNGLYNFTGQNAEEYPTVLAMPEGATELKMTSDTLANNITRSIFATAAEELRPVMNGIYFDLTNEALSIVASDGHKLVRNKNFGIKSNSPTSFILPKKPAALLKNVLVKDDSEITIRFDERNADITFGDSVLQCRLIEGRYPNYNSVIPQDNPNKLTIDRKILIGALRRVLPFASESSQLVRLHMEPGKLEISSEDIDFATSAKEEVVCDYAGNPMNIGFKGSSLNEILNNLTSDEVELQLADPSRPCLIVPATQPENEDILMLIMPMLLND
ncbi:MAG: DNA polymerase III subunit beta [Prevotellaceae bacterium]|nr:DNA polymerase III subunit beta [Prevotella sp.]MDD7258331.1 DNA polymerase III subunit beta [Prevotellaceae bacterium]MDY6130641.1 DNA polymerase III subunit beta [Prevotella sp.]